MQVYNKHLRYTCGGAADLYLEDVRVDPGKIIVVRAVAGYFVNQATTEVSQFYVKHGADRYFFGEDFPKVTSGIAAWKGYLAIGEGDQLGVYLPNIAAAEVGHLHIFGEHCDKDVWEGKG